MIKGQYKDDKKFGTANFYSEDGKFRKEVWHSGKVLY